MYVFLCVCVYVCEAERAREGETEAVGRERNKYGNVISERRGKK
jgi:hypothetical protein